MGRHLFQVLVEIAPRKGPHDTILARPVFLAKKTWEAMEEEMNGVELTTEQKNEIRADNLEPPLQFWHALGLRRVGALEWLGLSSDRDHAATRLPEEKDAEKNKQACCEC